MSSNLPTKNPTGYVGLRETNVGQLYFRTRPPNGNIDFRFYTPGDRWIDTRNDTCWTLLKKNSTFGTWIGFSGGVGDLEQLTPDVGAAVTPLANNINVRGVAGSGVVTSNGGAAIFNIGLTGNPSFFWTPSLAVQPMLVNRGYFAIAVGPTVLTLPPLSSAGDIIYVQGANGAGTWSIHQNAGQGIIFDNVLQSTPGIGGRVDATNSFDGIQLLCTLANIGWVVLNVKGNPIFV